MNEPLHPLSLGEILDRTAQMYRTRFMVYLGIGAVPACTVLVFAALAFVLLSWAGSGGPDPIAQGAQRVVAVLILGLLGLLALPACLGTTALGWAAMSQAAARGFLGESITIRDAYRGAWKRGWRYVGLYALLALIVAVGPVLIFVGGTVLLGVLAALGRRSGAGDTLTTFIGFGVFALVLVLGVLAAWILLRLSLAYPACVVEELGPWAAIKRGNRLSQGTRGRIFLLFLLGAVLGWMLILGAMVPVAIGMALIPAANAPQHAELVGRVFLFAWYGLSFAVQAFTKPVYGIALTLFYFDQRIRTEGFDIEWMMQNAGMVAAPPPVVEAVPWLPPLGSAAASVVAPQGVADLREEPAAQAELPHTGDPA